MLMKNIVFLILSAYTFSALSESTDNLDLVAFWSAVAHSSKIRNNPEFRKHADAQLQRVRTLKRSEGNLEHSGPGVSSFFDKFKGSTQGLKEKMHTLKEKYMSPKKETHTATKATKAKEEAKKHRKPKSYKSEKHHKKENKKEKDKR